MNQAPTEWPHYVNETLSTSTCGKFTTKDKSVILEWKKTDIKSPDLAAFKKEICELACQTLAPIEVKFLQKYPEAVSHELFLKPCAPYLQETVDWKMVQETVHNTMRQFYLIDLLSFGEAVIKPLLDDLYFCITLKDQESKNLLGFMLAAITPALAFGNVKVINIVVTAEGKNRGLEECLMSSLFNIIPQLKRIFLYVRPTNEDALRTYCSWGFTQNLNPVEDPNHKVNKEYQTLLEYNAQNSDRLQNTAKVF